MKAVVAVTLFLCSACVAFAQTFSDDFRAGKLDTSKWTVATYRSPDSKPGLNSGTYVQENLDFSRGMLCIKVTQQKGGPDNILSYGGAIISKERFRPASFSTTTQKVKLILNFWATKTIFGSPTGRMPIPRTLHRGT